MSTGSTCKPRSQSRVSFLDQRGLCEFFVLSQLDRIWVAFPAHFFLSSFFFGFKLRKIRLILLCHHRTFKLLISCKQYTSHVTFFSFTARMCNDVSHDIVCARHPIHVSCA